MTLPEMLAIPYANVYMTSLKSYDKLCKCYCLSRLFINVNMCLRYMLLKAFGCFQNEMDRSTNLEKADILELTIDYLRLLRSQNDQHRVNGYRRCAREVADFVRSSCLDKDVGRRLETFLSVRQSHAVADDGSNRAADTRPTFGATAGFHEPFHPSSGLWQENYRHLNMCFGLDQLETDNPPQTGVRNSPPVNNVQSAEVDTTIKDERRLTQNDTKHHTLEMQQVIQNGSTLDTTPGDQSPQQTVATSGCSTDRSSSVQDNGPTTDQHLQRTKPQNKNHPLTISSAVENVELKHDEFIWRPW